MRPSVRLVALLIALVPAGCAGRAATIEAVASASVGGVDVTASAEAWRGWPARLDRVVTPVLVRLVNHGPAAVRVDVTAFTLTLAEGRRLAAVLPADVRGVVDEPAPAVLPAAGVALGPTRERSGPGWALNETAPDPRVDPSLEPTRTWELPSADVFDQALPEGMLTPGGTLKGFLYFERAPRGTDGVTLTWPIVDISGSTLGVAVVPLPLR